MLNRRQFVASSAAAAFAAPALGKRNGERPNILFIMADDLGYADVGCYGRDDIATPNIDALAASGMKFTHGYSNSSVCSPTRVGLITGRYQYRLPVSFEEPMSTTSTAGLEPGQPTLPSLLRKAGYQTALVGKWHLGTPLKFSPLKHGYDHFWGIRGGGVDYFSHRFQFESAAAQIDVHDLWDGDVETNEVGYLTNLIGEHAAGEIQRMAASPAPFFLSLHFTAPHWPWESETDQEIAKHLRSSLHFDGGSMATYRAMVETLDRNIGRVLAALEASGRASNTIVVFTSDNGGERFSKTWPFNGMKGELLEGGIRVPLIVRWPGHVAAGSTSEQVAISMDWLPTLVAAAGSQPDREHPSDGMNLIPALTGGVAQPRTLFWRHKAHEQQAMRQGQWKYLKIGRNEFLFDVVADPQERGNLKNLEPERFSAMKTAWAQWNATMLPYPENSVSWSNKAMGTLPDRY